MALLGSDRKDQGVGLCVVEVDVPTPSAPIDQREVFFKRMRVRKCFIHCGERRF